MSASESPQDSVSRQKETARKLNRTTYGFAKHWLLFVNIALGIFVILPFVAPVLMYLGLEGPGQAIHVGYMAFCHQFPQRSYFFFGPETMYSLEQVAEVWPDASNPLTLRRFIGNAEMGWKVAWSDRMVSMYGGMFLFGLVYAAIRNRFSIRGLGFLGVILLSIPMAIDGGSHAISDLFGLGEGFRYNNLWLAELTNYAFDMSFYAGNHIGSFNWWMRLITGLLFALGVIWFAFPLLESSFRQTRREIEAKFQHAGLDIE